MSLPKWLKGGLIGIVVAVALYFNIQPIAYFAGQEALGQKLFQFFFPFFGEKSPYLYAPNRLLLLTLLNLSPYFAIGAITWGLYWKVSKKVFFAGAAIVILLVAGFLFYRNRPLPLNFYTSESMCSGVGKLILKTNKYYTQENCFRGLAWNKNDPTFCAKINREPQFKDIDQASCYELIAKKLKDPAICNNINEKLGHYYYGTIRAGCITEVNEL